MPPAHEFDHFTIWYWEIIADRHTLLIRTSDGLGLCIIFGSGGEHIEMAIEYESGNGFDAILQVARNVPSRTVFIEPQTRMPIPCFVHPVDFSKLFLGLKSPHPGLPIFDKPTLYFYPNFLTSDTIKPVQLSPEGIPYLYKSFHRKEVGLQNLQREVDNYVRLRDSPYILPIRGLVRCDDWTFEISDSGAPNPVQSGALCGLVIPFCGACSTLWYPSEWTPFEKEVLAVGLLDAVLDIELRGIHLSDLKRANVLLTPRGLRLIDIDAHTVTHSFYNPSYSGSIGTVYNFGRTLSELFVEDFPDGGPIEGTPVGDATPVMQRLIRSCTYYTEYNSMKELYDATFDMLQPIRTRTDITVTTLAELRHTRLRMQARSFEEAWLGCIDDVTWAPDFKEQKCSNLRFFDTTGKYCQTIWCTNFNQPVEDCTHFDHLHPVDRPSSI